MAAVKILFVLVYASTLSLVVCELSTLLLSDWHSMLVGMVFGAWMSVVYGLAITEE